MALEYSLFFLELPLSIPRPSFQFFVSILMPGPRFDDKITFVRMITLLVCSPLSVCVCAYIR